MYWIHSNSLLIVYQQYYYRVWQKNLTIWLYSSEQNHWYGDVALEGTSSTTQRHFSHNRALVTIPPSLWRPISKTTIQLLWLSRYFLGTSTSLLVATIYYCCGWQRNVRETSSATKKISRKTVSCKNSWDEMSVSGCHKVPGFQQAEIPLH
jgi:hypothetical protein